MDPKELKLIDIDFSERLEILDRAIETVPVDDIIGSSLSPGEAFRKELTENYNTMISLLAVTD